ncbi:ATP-binding protein [Haloarcula amylovorans]|uniref:ATP-binding protein n=1 Tax=Haloarcula amylovorans TaxID=2562280 RepID=UPI0010767006|nr:ATP-binding protein [Halomicroarcula amylolytica]
MTESIQVLFIKNNDDFTQQVLTRLEHEENQFSVTRAPSGRAGVDRLKDNSIDCVVSVYDLPEQTGIEVLDTVRTVQPAVPFILCTKNGSEEIASDAISAGVSEYLRITESTNLYDRLASQIPALVSQSHINPHDNRETDHQQYRDQLIEITAPPKASPDERISQLLELGCQRLDLANGHVVKIEESRERHEVVAVAGADIVQEGVTDLSNTYCRKTIQQDGMLEVYNAPAQGWEGDPAYEAFELGCYLGAKLRVDEGLYGTVCFVRDDPRDQPFTPAETTFFEYLRQWFTQLLERKRRLTQAETVFNQVQDAIFLVNADCENSFSIQRVNQAYEELVGFSADALHGKTVCDVIGEEIGTEIEARYEECVERCEPLSYEVADAVDGEATHLQTKLAPVIENGDVIQLVGATRDITIQKEREQELKHRREELNALVEELERSNAELEQFASVVAHDLKEPLRTISSYLQLLERRYAADLDEDGREFIEFAIDGADRMQQMIADILEFARIGCSESTTEPVDCNAVLDEVREMLLTDREGCEVTVDSLPTVIGNSTQLAKVFQNLIGNAIDHSDGEVSICVTATCVDDKWRFTVADTGPGIPPAQQDQIFDLFTAIGDSGGTGVGLAICKKIIDRHGGGISVDSTVGEGTTFSFTLPVAESAI